ncbi:peptidoglycan-binding protein [Streptomyces mangrovisoli]|uniref:NlpC/P60 domain-containing protein n=1 Tax=Streptomyces mangrovisoli TaxID=1428628 RepID=A0A1J4NJZ0_9ACTN|nr:peptidoglycan-binding protein [Streptomyces mangrovisoli]OIJ62697.1 hypothetical protein WN71_038095 [Streptomyces mangrovisoli]
METPVFEEFDPASDCDCPGCVRRRRVASYSGSGGPVGRPAAQRTLIVAAAATAVVGVGHPASAVAAPQPPHGSRVDAGEEPPTPQGGTAPLHGPGGSAALPPGATRTPATTRTEIIKRARKWVTERVPYDMEAYWSDGYRQDCSGFVSMAWGLPGNEWTGSLDQYGTRISKGALEPGDMLLFHNPDDPEKGSHVVLFGGWTDSSHTTYTVYEETPPQARSQPTPYPYWSNGDKYVPYRYKGLTSGAAGAEAARDAKDPAGAPKRRRAAGTAARGAGTRAPASHGVPGYPGRANFRPGADNPHVTRLGSRLVEKGFGKYYTNGPGPRWGEADRRGVEAFQRAQGWRGGAADGYPGPETWRRLFS